MWEKVTRIIIMRREDVALAKVESTITEHSLGPWGRGWGGRDPDSGMPL